MSRHSKEQQLVRKARQAFLKDERDRQIEQRIAGEAKRLADSAAKTAKLRELRLAKEATERAAASTPAPKRRK
jgi:hypothetical protein